MRACMPESIRQTGASALSIRNSPVILQELLIDIAVVAGWPVYIALCTFLSCTCHKCHDTSAHCRGSSEWQQQALLSFTWCSWLAGSCARRCCSRGPKLNNACPSHGPGRYWVRVSDERCKQGWETTLQTFQCFGKLYVFLMRLDLNKCSLSYCLEVLTNLANALTWHCPDCSFAVWPNLLANCTPFCTNSVI